MAESRARPAGALAAVTVASGALEHDRARALVLEYGWNTTAYQILNPGFELWFARSRPAVVGFVRTTRRRVAAGAPVCADEHLAEVAAEFERDAASSSEHVVYFGAEGRLGALYSGDGNHALLPLGAQPTWRPADWTAIIASHASLRAQLNRARNKGVRVELWAAERAERNPALQRCLSEWLLTRGLPPLHFLVEPETLDSLQDRRVFVATRDGAPVGFLVASPIAARNGWLTEQFVRGAQAPNGTAELMIDAAVRWMADANATYVTLGLAPLSNRAQVAEPRSWWMRAGFTWLRAHGRRFYNFGGLDAFKAKFAPEAWEPVYAIANERRFSVMSLYSIAAAFTQGRPVRTVVRGLGSAARQEMRWMTER